MADRYGYRDPQPARRDRRHIELGRDRRLVPVWFVRGRFTDSGNQSASVSAKTSGGGQ